MQYATREEATQAVKTLVNEWGAEFVVRVLAEQAQETSKRFNLTPGERELFWSSLRVFLKG